MILYITEGHSAAYSIDSEGTMYYVPITEGGTIYLDDLDILDREDVYEGCYEPELDEVQDQLIKMAKASGTYFQK